MAIDTKPKHFIVHAIPAAWGHNKPLCAFIVHILESQPDVIVTYLTAALIYPKIIAEFNRLSLPRFQAIEARLNIIDIAGLVPGLEKGKPIEAFGPTFTKLYQTFEPITCFSSNKTFHRLPRPTLAMVDPFASYAFESIRAVAGKKVPILMWWTSNAGSFLRMTGPAHLGGVTSPALDTPEGRAAMKQRIRSREPIKPHDCTGKIVRIAGLEPRYDYEWFPQQSMFADIAPLVEAIKAVYIREADGLLCVSANAYEPEAMAAARAWYASMNKVWYSIGPLSMNNPGVKGSTAPKLETDALTEVFLNRIQKEFGEKSLIYISFGSLIWPTEEDRLWAIIDGLLEKRQPFLMSHPSPFIKFPDDKKRQIADSGIAMELNWAPQELILAHPVTGWFITHAGWNSLQEAITARVPLILWPFQSDQPYNTMRLTSLKASFELVEVRSGVEGERIPYGFKQLPAFTPASAKAEMESLVGRLKGDEGRIVRENFETLSNAISRAWDVDGGESRRDMKQMIENFL